VYYGLRVCALQGESEANKEVDQREKDQGEKNLSKGEKEGLKGGF